MKKVNLLLAVLSIMHFTLFAQQQSGGTGAIGQQRCPGMTDAEKLECDLQLLGDLQAIQVDLDACVEAGNFTPQECLELSEYNIVDAGNDHKACLQAACDSPIPES